MPEDLRLSSILSSYSARNLSLRLENDYKATFFYSLDIQSDPIPFIRPLYGICIQDLIGYANGPSTQNTSLTSKELGQSCTCGKGPPES